MNTFELTFTIDDKRYDLFVDSSNDDYKRIVINNKELVNERFTLLFNPRLHKIYYPINISGNSLVVSIDDTSLSHEYNIYLNNVSLLDNTELDEEYTKAIEQTKNGLKNFVKNNWLTILKDNILAIFISFAGVFWLWYHSFRKFIIMFFGIFIIILLLLPAFILGEWLHLKGIIKKHQNCFREEKTL